MAWILDLDGALLDSERWHKRAEMETFGEFELSVTEADLWQYSGMTFAHMVDDVARRHGSHLVVDEFLEAHRPRLLRYVRDEMRLHDDAIPFLEKLPGPTAMATNSLRWYVDAVLSAFPQLAFDATVSEDEVEKGKPAPDSYLKAASLLGVEPSNCIALEDTGSGVSAARAAGCRVIAIRRDERADLRAADVIVNSLSEIDPLSVHHVL